MKKSKKSKISSCCNVDDIGKRGGGTYLLGFIGAATYYISTSTGFWNGLLGVLKALVWPAFLVYEALKYFGM